VKKFGKWEKLNPGKKIIMGGNQIKVKKGTFLKGHFKGFKRRMPFPGNKEYSIPRINHSPGLGPI